MRRVQTVAFNFITFMDDNFPNEKTASILNEMHHLLSASWP